MNSSTENPAIRSVFHAFAMTIIVWWPFPVGMALAHFLPLNAPPGVGGWVVAAGWWAIILWAVLRGGT